MTNRKTIIFVISLMLFVLCSGFKGCDDEVARIHRSLDGAAGIPKHESKFTTYQETPGKVKVVAVDKIPADYLNAIDEGIKIQIAAYDRKKPEWVSFRSTSDYALVTVQPSGFTQETLPIGTPMIHVHGIGSAGTCIGCEPRSSVKRPYIVVPSFKAVNWAPEYRDAFVQAVRNESEHVRESRNDYGEYLYWANAGDIHPHAP